MEKDKKNTVTYTLKICFNPDTDEVEYIAEGIDEDFDFTPINPFSLSKSHTKLFTSEDMEAIKKLYDIKDY